MPCMLICAHVSLAARFVATMPQFSISQVNHAQTGQLSDRRRLPNGRLVTLDEPLKSHEEILHCMQVKDQLNEQLLDRGVIIEQVLLRKITFPVCTEHRNCQQRSLLVLWLAITRKASTSGWLHALPLARMILSRCRSSLLHASCRWCLITILI